MTRRVLIGLGIAGLICFVGYPSLIGGQTVSWHQRLTVIVDTPAGEVRGASVTEVSWSQPSKLILRDLDRGSLGLVRGEAAMIEIKPGHWLFALLDGQERLLVDQLSHGRGVEAALPDILAQQAPLVLPEKAWPVLVTFDDLSDPETVRKVDPINMAMTFGAGVTLRGMTLEVTEEGVTEGLVERVLGWLRSIWPNRLDGQRYGTSETDNRLANDLASGSFSTEIKK